MPLAMYLGQLIAPLSMMESWIVVKSYSVSTGDAFPGAWGFVICDTCSSPAIPHRTEKFHLYSFRHEAGKIPRATVHTGPPESLNRLV